MSHFGRFAFWQSSGKQRKVEDVEKEIASSVSRKTSKKGRSRFSVQVPRPNHMKIVVEKEPLERTVKTLTSRIVSDCLWDVALGRGAPDPVITLVERDMREYGEEGPVTNTMVDAYLRRFCENRMLQKKTEQLHRRIQAEKEEKEMRVRMETQLEMERYRHASVKPRLGLNLKKKFNRKVADISFISGLTTGKVKPRSSTSGECRPSMMKKESAQDRADSEGTTSHRHVHFAKSEMHAGAREKRPYTKVKKVVHFAAPLEVRREPSDWKKALFSLIYPGGVKPDDQGDSKVTKQDKSASPSKSYKE